MCLFLSQCIQWCSKLDNWKRAHIHIFVFTDHKKQSISKDINCVHRKQIYEHVPPIIEGSPPPIFL